LKHSEESLKKQFKNFKEAKTHFGLNARGWKALADKLNSPSAEQLQSQVKELLEKIAVLEQENTKLRQTKDKFKDFDEVGFWLLDRNFNRSKFEDLEISEDATERESVAKAEHKRLATKYHPDSGGTDEQMANVNRLLEQMMALVKMNGGVGL